VNPIRPLWVDSCQSAPGCRSLSERLLHPPGHPPFSQITAGTSIYTNLDERFGKIWIAQRAYWELVLRGKIFFFKKADVG